MKQGPAWSGPAKPSTGPGQIGVTHNEEDVMKTWKRPLIREITCGMEINGYFPAEI